MNHELPPLAWLRAFEASARHSNFTAAAAELNLTQSAVSHQVRSLEKHLGVALFERLARRLRLTEMGSAYLPPLRKTFDELAAATAGLFGPIGRRSLMISAPVSFAALWLAPRLRGFADAYPDISLRIATAVWADAQQDERTDIDIRYGDGNWPGYRADLIKRFPAIPVCRPDLIGNGDIGQRLAALARCELIHVTGSEDLWQRLLRPHGLEAAPYAGINVDTSLAALELAAAGFGPALVLECYAAPYIAAGRLINPIDATLPIEQAHYLLVADSAQRLRPEHVLFSHWLMAQARA